MATKRYLGDGPTIEGQRTPSPIVFSVPLNPATGDVSQDGAQNVKPVSRTPKGYQQIDNAQLASSTPLNVPAGATVAIIQNNHTQPMRWRDDGTAPTGTAGLRIAPDPTAPLIYDGNLSAFRIIKQADGVGTVDIWYGA